MAPSHVGPLVTEEELAKSSSQLEQSEKKVKKNDKYKILQNKIPKHGWRQAKFGKQSALSLPRPLLSCEICNYAFMFPSQQCGQQCMRAENALP